MKLLYTLYKYFRFWGGSYRCIVCDRQVRTYFPFSYDLQRNAKSNGFPYDFNRMETLNVEKCNCPFCMSNDRERLYLIFLEKYLGDHHMKKKSILDFAPNHAFSAKLRKDSSINYTSTDLFRDDVDIQMDICDMKEVDKNSYDIIICSHILEHVPDPSKALKEIFRIMRTDGVAIIMVPLFWDVLNTLENNTHTTDELRLKHYGQEDHVRLFSRNDFLSLIKSAGFSVQELRTSDFDPEKIKENAIADNSVLYICTNPDK